MVAVWSPTQSVLVAVVAATAAKSNLHPFHVLGCVRRGV